ncbi:DUF669 domain-containing protein [Candidatus Acetothermia bacterium]|nr:DUF669 domain-containing protein [Candidatus Acetothermia bacterium]
MSTMTVTYQEFKPVKPGSHRVKIKALTRKASTFKEGEQAIKVDFEILEGEFKGRTVSKTYSQRLTPRAKLTELIMRILGPLKDGQVVDLLALSGKECEIVVTTETGKDG